MAVDVLFFEHMGFPFPIHKVGRRVVWNCTPSGLVQFLENIQRLEQRLIGLRRLKRKGCHEFLRVFAQLSVAIHQQLHGIHLRRRRELLGFIDRGDKTLPGEHRFNSLIGIHCGFFRTDEGFAHPCIEPDFFMEHKDYHLLVREGFP